MNRLQFDYQVYFWQNCVLPLILLFFCLVIFGCTLVDVLSKNYESIRSFFIQNVRSLFGILIFVLLISLNILPLIRGGFFLLFERESDSLKIEGIVEDTFELSWYGGCKYEVDQNDGNGEGIVINGNKYFLMTYGDLQKGDHVIIKVLPKSKLILEIEPINETSCY